MVNGSAIYGEWIQLYYNKGFSANSISLYGITASNTKCPNSFTLVGSIDSSNWILLTSQTGISSYTTGIAKTFSIYNFTSYNYYRLITTKTNGDSNLSISEIQFTGIQNSSYITNDNYNSIIYNTNEKQFPPKIYDSTTAEATALSGEIICVPATPIKQTLTITNLGTYTVYSSTSTATATVAKQYLFDFNTASTTNYGSWATAQYTAGSYSSATNSTIGINNTIKGDWIVIKFPFKIVLTKFIFNQLTTAVNNSPASWRCYGSNDGINFIEITDASQLGTATYTTNAYQQTLPSTFDTPYLYIGWVITKLIGGAATQLQFVELQIFGKDDITTNTNRISINGLGSVGIGTTNPLQKLHVQATSPAMIRIETNVNAASQVAGIEFGIPNFPTTGSAKILSTTYAGDIADLQLYTSSGTNNSTSKMTIMGSGNVGVGTTSPNSTIHLHSTSTATDIKIQLTDATTGTTVTSGSAIIKTGATQDLWFQNYQNANINIITKGSNINLYTLGSSQKSAYLEYSGYFYAGVTATNPGLRLAGWDANTIFLNNGILGLTALSNINFNTGTTLANYATRVTIDTSGNVGIGTATPNSKLDVNGAILCANGNSAGASTNNQLLFSWSGNYSMFKHAIKSRHQSTANNSDNAIDFYVWQTTDASNAVGTKQVMSVTSTGVGIGTTTANCRLQLATETVPKQICLYEVANNNYNFIGFGNGGGMLLQINSTSSDSFIFNVANNPTSATGNVELVRIVGSNGNVGIGTNNPNAKLHVNSGTASTGAITAYYFSNSTTITTNATGDSTVCAQFESAAWSKTKFIVSSDERIKKNITDIDDDGALQKILNVQPKTYQYIDNIERGNNIVYGFIAQQIQEVIPEAVTVATETIPNIYSICDCSNNIITLPDNIISSNIVNINDEITIIDGINYDKQKYTVTDITNNQITIDNNLIGSNCFVYGTKVNDFYTLNKDYIFTLNVCATQDLYKLIQQQSQTIQQQTQQIQNLQSQIDEIKQKLGM